MTSAQVFGLLALAILVSTVAVWVRALRAPASTRRTQIVGASLFCVPVVAAWAIFLSKLANEQTHQAVSAPGWQIVTAWALVALVVVAVGVLVVQSLRAARARQ
jgi:hypothetical protein